jgi:hypothetical protein
MFKNRFSIRNKVMAVINAKIDKAQKELEAEVKQLHSDFKLEVKMAEERLEQKSEQAVNNHVNNILKGII